MKTDEIRKKFLEFFEKKDHKIFLSDSLIPDDPSVLFTSAGMNQFKAYFLGEKKDIKRAASSQKCLRADDLEDVGKTPYHHTFFEMLGNFSFGDYFKKEAIEFAWEFVVEVLNIKKENIWVSVFIEDIEAYNLWSNHIGISEDKIVKLGEDKNFWPANAPTLGPNGPCGPCSEIFFDRGKGMGCKKDTCNPACGCLRFVEFWNLVFTQFNRIGENKLESLPQKNIDTGMGLERISAIMQDKNSNFEIDIFYTAIEFLKELFKVDFVDNEIISLINAIADHSRAAIFAIADDVYPSNEERGYVIRKIIRRAIGLANSLGYRKPFLYKLVDIFSELMKQPYPELVKKKPVISKILKIEEEKFIPILEEVDNYVCNKSFLGAEELFYLYDTLGFPIEAIQSSAKKYRTTLNFEGFDALLKKQREASRRKSMFTDSIFKKSSISLEEVSDFVGYENLETEANIIKLLIGVEEKELLKEEDIGIIILDKTPFYPEGGGQLSDKGIINTESGEFFVEEVYKVNEAILHKGKVVRGKIIKQKASAKVDKLRRKALTRAHTATHLLQSALRRLFGEHITQQGSLVDVDRLHFDFSHFKNLTAEELENVENLVNEFILKADKVNKYIVSLQEAKKEDVLAFFKDKYREKVRIVSIGDYSKELCAGLHVDDTSEVGIFVILNEFSISSGIRRIEAVVGREAYNYFGILKRNTNKLCNLLKCKDKELINSLKNFLENSKKQKDKILLLEKENLTLRINDILKAKIEIEGIGFLAYLFKDKEYPALLYLSDIVKQRTENLFIFFISEIDKKHIFVCSATEDLIKRNITPANFTLHFKEALSIKGGGRKELQQGILKGDEKILEKLKFYFNKFLSNFNI